MKVFHSQKKSFLVIAHRGASYSAPENTMTAFKLAQKKGADMIELDVILTRDKIPVVVHDNHLKKYGHHRKVVTNLTYNEIKDLDVGSWFSPIYSNQTIPTLQQVLKWAKNRTLLNIEIKPDSVTESSLGGVEEKVIGLIHSYDMSEQVLLSSFDYRVLKRFKNIAPEIRTGLLFNKKESNGMGVAELTNKYNSDTFHCTWLELYRFGLKNLNNFEIPVFIYTVNNKWMMKKLINRGVSGIFSDKPELLKQVAENL